MAKKLLEETKYNIDLFAEEGNDDDSNDDGKEGNDGEDKEGGNDDKEPTGKSKEEQEEIITKERLDTVVAQREQFRTQAENMAKQLEELKEKGNLSDEYKDKVDDLMKQNTQLLVSLDEANLRLEVITEAMDAINPQDLLMFIERDNVKLAKDGKSWVGVKEEVARLRKDKAYLFKSPETGRSGRQQREQGSGGKKKSNINDAIRSAKGRTGNINI